MEAKNSAGKVVYCHGAGTALDVSSDIFRTLQRALLSGALQACSTPLHESNRYRMGPLGTGWDTHTQRRNAERTCIKKVTKGGGTAIVTDCCSCGVVGKMRLVPNFQASTSWSP